MNWKSVKNKKTVKRRGEEFCYTWKMNYYLKDCKSTKNGIRSQMQLQEVIKVP